MRYRPQYAYPAPPPGIVEEDFLAYFDPTIIAVLGQSLGASQTVFDIPLQFQRDAAYSIRGLKLEVLSTNPIGLYFKDAFAKPISESDIYISTNAYESNPSAAYPGSLVVPFEPELQNPAGATLFLSFQNLLATTTTLNIAVVFFGIKRYPSGLKMQDCERPRHDRALVTV
jgi:hypothetical protein